VECEAQVYRRHMDAVEDRINVPQVKMVGYAMSEMPVKLQETWP
jgi:hypothetical protein